MRTELLIELWQRHSGKITGMFIGLLIGIFILVFGFLNTLFVIICMAAGYVVGKRIDEKEDIMEILGKILPQGYHRQ